jgi:hypothetical protein
VVFLPGLGWCGQGWWVDDLADLAGEVFGGGAAEADGEDDVEVASAEPDKPHVSGGAAAAAAGAVVDLDLQGFSGVGMGGAVRGGATGGGAVDPGPAAGVAEYRVGAAGPSAAGFVS